jgi:hypothetical protein
MGFEERLKLLCDHAARCSSEDQAIELTREWKEVLQQMVDERRPKVAGPLSKDEQGAAA